MLTCKVIAEFMKLEIDKILSRLSSILPNYTDRFSTSVYLSKKVWKEMDEHLRGLHKSVILELLIVEWIRASKELDKKKEGSSGGKS